MFVVLLGLAIVLWPTHGSAQVPDRDIDLVSEKGLHLLSQVTYTWAGFPVGENSDFNITSGQCGCFITNLSTLANFYYGTTSVPLFPWKQLYLDTPFLSFSPRYFTGPTHTTGVIGISVPPIIACLKYSA